MTSINTNLSSLIVQKNLTKSTNGLNQAIERLTTGFKINHASDNAANYSISESMSSKLSSYFVAEENTSMGLDLIQTQSSTLDTIQNLTTRLRALAEQAHNGTYGAQSLAAINQEADAIISEIERIGNNAEYNGIKLFDNAISQSGIPQLKSNGLMQEIERRDTSGMTRLADVDENTSLAVGTYSISSAEELAKLATMRNNGKITNGSEFVLGADIDLSAYSEGEGWVPIGYGRNVGEFTGTFDGNGYTISNLQSSQGGLFARTKNATIKNLKLTDVNISSEASCLGGIVGDAGDYTTIQNCYVSGSVEASGNCVGLLVGKFNALHDGLVENCYTSGTVVSSGNGCAGGVAGELFISGLTTNTFVKNCFSDADVIALDGDAGGVFGDLTSTNVSGCGSSGSIKGFCAGGISGYVNFVSSRYDVKNSLFTGNVSGEYAGMVTGKINGQSDDISIMYDSLLNNNLNLFGDKDDYNYNVKLQDIASQLQVGVDSTESSIIKFTTNISLASINSLRFGGMEGVNSLENIDNFISKLSDAQTKLGAVENRLTSTLESISVNVDNLTSSRST